MGRSCSALFYYIDLRLKNCQPNQTRMETNYSWKDTVGVLSGAESVKVEHAITVPDRTLITIGLTILLTAIFSGVVKKLM